MGNIVFLMANLLKKFSRCIKGSLVSDVKFHDFPMPKYSKDKVCGDVYLILFTPSDGK